MLRRYLSHSKMYEKVEVTFDGENIIFSSDGFSYGRMTKNSIRISVGKVYDSFLKITLDDENMKKINRHIFGPQAPLELIRDEVLANGYKNIRYGRIDLCVAEFLESANGQKSNKRWRLDDKKLLTRELVDKYAVTFPHILNHSLYAPSVDMKTPSNIKILSKEVGEYVIKNGRLRREHVLKKYGGDLVRRKIVREQETLDMVLEDYDDEYVFDFICDNAATMDLEKWISVLARLKEGCCEIISIDKVPADKLEYLLDKKFNIGVVWCDEYVNAIKCTDKWEYIPSEFHNTMLKKNARSGARN
jgi:hypothetical protein